MDFIYYNSLSLNISLLVYSGFYPIRKQKKALNKMNSFKNSRSRILCPALAIRVNVRVNRTIYYFILSPEEVETDEFEFY